MLAPRQITLQVKTTVGREVEIDHFFGHTAEGVHEPDLVFSRNGWPSLMQLRAFDMLGDDVLATHWVMGVVAPVNDPWNGYGGFGLNYKANGTFATIRFPLSRINKKTRLNPPSTLSYEAIEVAPALFCKTRRQRASKSN